MRPGIARTEASARRDGFIRRDAGECRFAGILGDELSLLHRSVDHAGYTNATWSFPQR